MTVSKHIDVLIVGAGISGIDVAYRLQERCPGKSWLILEARERVGGTWDLFRYPGVRSDSDMFTLGFPFRPWRSDLAIAGGDAIRDYIEDSAREFGILDKILFHHRVTGASWSSADRRWTVTTSDDTFTCSWLYLASGYYDYDQGYRPEWPGEADYSGKIIHPQFWPESLDTCDKRIAVIGSGATAMTLVPALADKAAHVTLVQRTPSYVVARPARDKTAAVLPASLVRWKNILLTILMYGRARKKPERVARWIKDQVAKVLPAGYPVERDFSPPYKPWDQRLCLVPDGDLFAAILSGKVSVETSAIERFTPTGLRLSNGGTVDADIIVTATGLKVCSLGKIEVDVDGRRVDPHDKLVWKGFMLDGVPNLAFAFGYINASWTLRSDLTARTFCRLLNHMGRRGVTVATPRPANAMTRKPVIEFSSGYVQRALASMPSQGDRQPWRVEQNHIRDLCAMTFGRIDDELEIV
jgi:cation diffusion facilitator CzcD-associated flavoprotein CzcO